MKTIYVVIDGGDFKDSYMEHVVGAYTSLDLAKKEIKSFLKKQIKYYKEDRDALELGEAKIFDLRKSLPVEEMLNSDLGFCYIDSSFECDYIRIIEVEVSDDGMANS